MIWVWSSGDNRFQISVGWYGIGPRIARPVRLGQSPLTASAWSVLLTEMMQG
jgi:hypothetical protein